MRIWNGTKKKIFDSFFFNFLGINTHNLVKNDSKFENKNLFDAKLYVDMIKFLDAKAVKLGVWSLKASLGKLEPKRRFKPEVGNPGSNFRT